MSSPRSIDACRALLEKDGIEVDALINNAGIYPGSDAVSVELAMIDEAWAVNARGPWLLCQAFVPRMRQRGYGRVVNISSGGGAFSEALAPDHAAYAVSKAALNALSLCLARSLDGDIKVNAMCPGWVRTRMGGSGGAPLPGGGSRYGRVARDAAKRRAERRVLSGSSPYRLVGRVAFVAVSREAAS